VGRCAIKRGVRSPLKCFEGNTGDPTTLSSQIQKVRERFALRQVVFVGDRGMLTSARIREECVGVEGLEWVSGLKSTQIQGLLEADAFQPSLFDETDMAEITTPEYPGERLVVCRNPLLAAERARVREALLQATEAELDTIVRATTRTRQRLSGQDHIGIRVGKVINPFKMGKHFRYEIRDQHFSYERNIEKIDQEKALDGSYVIRTSVSSERLSTEDTVYAYKSLSQVERAFRSCKTMDLRMRPIYHCLPHRVKAYIFLCMLAYYVEWHMRQLLAPMLCDDADKDRAQALRPSPQDHRGWFASTQFADLARRLGHDYQEPSTAQDCGCSYGYDDNPANSSTEEKEVLSVAEKYPYRATVPPVPPGTCRPLWSVMIPTYHCATYLRQTLASVLAQDPGPEVMQIEVIDDHSTADDPAAVVEAMGHGRIGFYRQPNNVGITRNFHTCLTRSRGTLIHLLHGDDCVRDGFYRTMQQAFVECPDIGAAFCRHIYMDEYGHLQAISPLEHRASGVLNNGLAWLAAEQRIMTPSMVVRREVYENLGGFDRRLVCSEDWEMWVRIATHYPIWYEVEPLAVYRMHWHSNTGRHLRTAEDMHYTRLAIDIFQSYLPVHTARDIANHARETYALSALDTAYKMLMRDDMTAALAQVQAALACRRSWKVLRRLLSVLVWGSAGWLRQRRARDAGAR
jgi:GT2 family glycosyltransferase